MAHHALSWPLTPDSGQLSHGELPFGDRNAVRPGAPWDVAREVSVPGTSLRILGRIDRLDLGTNGTRARVVDYKTYGKTRGILARWPVVVNCSDASRHMPSRHCLARRSR